MTDLTTRLRAADPVRLEPGLSSDERDAMRLAVVRAADTGAPRLSQWRAPLALAAMAVLAVIGAAAAHRFADDHERGMAVIRHAPPAATQLQFRTPGGTRIIWTIDPAFQLEGGRR